jgi:hypothetical protein
VPLLLSLTTGVTWRLWVMSSVVNAFISGGDVIIGFVVIAQIPLSAWCRGLHTWWQVE